MDPHSKTGMDLLNDPKYKHFKADLESVQVSSQFMKCPRCNATLTKDLVGWDKHMCTRNPYKKDESWIE